MKLLHFCPCGIAFDRARPVSMTYLMPGTVSEVSATLVASTMRRFTPVGWKILCCSACDRRANRAGFRRCGAAGICAGLRRLRGFRVRPAGTAKYRLRRVAPIRPPHRQSRRSARLLHRLRLCWSAGGRGFRRIGAPLTSSTGAPLKCWEKRSASMVAEVMMTFKSGRRGRSCSNSPGSRYSGCVRVLRR